MALNFPPFGYSEIRMEMSVGREEEKKNKQRDASSWTRYVGVLRRRAATGFAIGHTKMTCAQLFVCVA